MKEKDIRKYAELMKELELSGLEITEDERKVRLERSVVTVAKEPNIAVADVSEGQDYISIKSPMVGVFYSSPAENAEPYVSVGDSIKKGQIICIIEAMKLMNEIPSDQEGIISEICVNNGQVVEYGTELFRIKG
ncbi:MAG: hypothetical protein J6D36_06635 [Erysipelotrichaceae bacterium]|nr:hypothetical protein [Erysipelotrichaceae bacterium]